jgi:2-polyprenyl-6-methoxyphenol hydroxylase-like FAD-dependent oxidoreductase
MMKRQRILIVGAGIAGLALGQRLASGHEIDIVEKAERLHTSGTGIMLGINAMQVLQKMGLEEAIKSGGRELQGFAISDHRGNPLSTLRFSDSIRAQGLGLYSIHRNRLGQALSRGLEPHIRFDTTVRKIYEDTHSVYVEFSDGQCKSYDLLIGADGIYSSVRRTIAPQVPLRYSGYTCWRFMIDTTPDDHPVEMWGRGHRLGVVPLSNGQTYVFMVVNAPAKRESLESFDAQRMAREFDYFSDIAPQVMTRLADASNMVHNDLYDLPTPVLGSRRILLSGDAAHATTPNMGQGAGMAIEDAWILSQIIDQAESVEDILPGYEQRRHQRVQQIVKMSYTLGKIAHWETPSATWLRNRLFSLIPDGLNARHMERLLLSY